MAEVSDGMGMPGLSTFDLWIASPLGINLMTAISMMRSWVMLMPVVSRSKKQSGFRKLSFMRGDKEVKKWDSVFSGYLEFFGQCRDVQSAELAGAHEQQVL